MDQNGNIMEDELNLQPDERAIAMGGPVLSGLASLYGSTLINSDPWPSAPQATVRLGIGEGAPKRNSGSTINPLFKDDGNIQTAGVSVTSCTEPRSKEEKVLDAVVVLVGKLIELKVSPDKAVDVAVELLLKKYNDTLTYERY